VPKPDLPAWPDIILDLDTGELRNPDGVDLGGLRIINVRVFLKVSRPGTKESFRVGLCREFPDKSSQAYIIEPTSVRETDCRDFMASVESELKLAAKLKEAKDRRRREDKEAKSGTK
jgi:hypothetical protein